jgi:hypothetical protein
MEEEGGDKSRHDNGVLDLGCPLSSVPTQGKEVKEGPGQAVFPITSPADRGKKGKKQKVLNVSDFTLHSSIR